LRYRVAVSPAHKLPLERFSPWHVSDMANVRLIRSRTSGRPPTTLTLWVHALRCRAATPMFVSPAIAEKVSLPIADCQLLSVPGENDLNRTDEGSPFPARSQAAWKFTGLSVVKICLDVTVVKCSELHKARQTGFPMLLPRPVSSVIRFIIRGRRSATARFGLGRARPRPYWPKLTHQPTITELQLSPGK